MSSSISSPPSKPSLFGRLGGAITKFRNFVVNTFFILVFVLVIAAVVASCQTVSVPTGSALLLNPEGLLVEERSYPDALGDFLQSQPSQVDLSSLLRAIELAQSDGTQTVAALSVTS